MALMALLRRVLSHTHSGLPGRHGHHKRVVSTTPVPASLGYRNPIVPGFHPDPSVCVVDGTFYMATSTFEYFPGVPIYASEDLVHWRPLGHALNRPSQLDMRTVEPGAGVFAPSLRYHQGRWYMATSVNFRFSARTDFEKLANARGFYVWTDDITDEDRWSDPIWFDTLGIDQDLFFDDDGQVYLSWAAQEPHVPFVIDAGPPQHINVSVYTVPIDLASGDSLEPANLVRRNRSTGNWVAEGPHILKRGGWYYLLTAEGGTEVAHQEWVSRSRTPLGPWETPTPASQGYTALVGEYKESRVNPILYNADDPDVQMTGHADLVQGPDGRWWAFCLATRNQGGKLSQLGRETFLLPVEWVDDWPLVNGGRRVALEGDPEAGLPRLPRRERWEFDFTPERDLHLEGWYFLRTPQKPFASLTSHPGSLAIRGGPYPLSVDENVTMALRKQTAFTGRWEIEFSFAPHVDEVAGVAVWWSKWAYGAILVRGTPVGRELVFRLPEGDGFRETLHALPGISPPGTYGPSQASVSNTEPQALHVAIDARPAGYTFSVGGVQVGYLPATKLVQNREFDSIFTGTFLGLFAHGNGLEACARPALFHRVSWEGCLGEP